MKLNKILSTLIVGILIIIMAGCQLVETTNDGNSVAVATEVSVQVNESLTDNTAETKTSVTSLLDVEDMFSNRDLEQEADLEDASVIELTDNQSLIIDEEGIYVLSGDVNETMITVDVDDEDKVQLVLDGLTITNKNMPAIYVKDGDKIFITTTDSDNELVVTDDYEADGDVNLDAVIYSKSDLVLNGLGTLIVTSEEGNGITSKDDLKITGGTIVIDSKEDGLEANDSIRIYDGDITITTAKDGLHSENNEDLSLGYIYIAGGNLTITSEDDAIHGTSVVQIDGGTITIPECVEGIEGNYILINDGTIDIYSTDDGINATNLSDMDVMIEINGGNITINMASGDTDAFDANGDIVINGGNIDLICGSSFDANNSTTYNAGNVVVNGETITDFTSISQGKKRK